MLTLNKVSQAAFSTFPLLRTHDCQMSVDANGMWPKLEGDVSLCRARDNSQHPVQCTDIILCVVQRHSFCQFEKICSVITNFQ